MTEMLKGTLEGIVLAILSVQPAYGYEITARLREQGFSDIAEGTVYALLVRIEQRGLVDVEKIPSEKGPPRKVYSLNAQGREYLEEFWRTWSFLAGRLERGGQDHGRENPVHAAQGRRGDCQRQRPRRRHATGERARVHQPHGTVRRCRRNPQRAGEPRAGRPVAAPQGPGHDRG